MPEEKKRPFNLLFWVSFRCSIKSIKEIKNGLVNQMKIKKVEVVPVKPNNGLVRFANLLFEEGLFLGSFGIFKKLDGSGFRLTYPNRKIGEMEITIFHPITKECSRNFEEHIFDVVKTIHVKI